MRTLARARDKAALLQRLRTLRSDSARRWGRMSAHQAVCHLTDACRMATGEKHVSPATSFRQRTIVKWMALYAPVPWPTGVLQTRPELEQAGEGSCPSDFDRDVRELEAQVELMTAAPKHFRWPPHPVFGAMSEAEWLRWGFLHLDHHLRQFGA